MRRTDGSLHFFINGIDLGRAATGVPENVFGVLDLYGRTTEVAIVPDVTGTAPIPVTETDGNPGCISAESDESSKHLLLNFPWCSILLEYERL